MENQVFCTPETTVYRQVKDELVVIQLESGKFFYFNPTTKEVLDYFKTPRSFGAFLIAAEATPTSERGVQLREFCRLLLENQLISEAESVSDSLVEAVKMSMPPSLIRRGEQTLDELTFLCP